MDYINMLRNHGSQASYIMSQYGSPSQAAHQHELQRHQLHQNQYQQPHQQQAQHEPRAQHTQQRQLVRGYSFPYTNDQLLVLAQMQHQRTMLNQAQAAVNAPPPTKQEQPKPRLSKDEVDLLEKEFQKNQKPSSGRKREIADLLKVDQPRINNWFQNRRAKEKGIKKTQEFAARQAAEQAELSEAGSRSSDTDAEGMGSDYFGVTNDQHSGQPSSAPFPASSSVGTGPSIKAKPAALSVAISSAPSVANDVSFASPLEQSPLRPSIEHSECGGEREEYPSPESLPFNGSEQTDLDFTPLAPSFAPAQQHQAEYQGDFSARVSDIVPHQLTHNFASPQPHNQTAFSQSQFVSTAAPEPILAPTPSFPSQLLGRFELQELEAEARQSGFGLGSKHSAAHQVGVDSLPQNQQQHQRPSPNSLPVSPPTSGDLRFKSPPPPANIASRRNKDVPAQLNATALRAYSYGPKTGFDLSKRSDAASQGMRRIASATGSTMPGRIQKSLAGGNIGGAAGAPRSPLYLERTKDALMRSLQSTAAARSPVLGSINNALSPMTPSGDYFTGLCSSAQGTREATVASSTSDDEQRYALGGGPAGFFAGPLKTPPGTPGLNLAGTGFSEHQMPSNMNAFEAAWNFNPQDEPLVTPGLGSFGSEEFGITPSAPGFVSSSQPPTPSFPHTFGPSAFAGPAYPWATAGPPVASFNNSGLPGHTGSISEYTFPDSFLPDTSARSSPSLPAKSNKQFQFTQNVTPQDFSEK